jgi:hypothetical protein
MDSWRNAQPRSVTSCKSLVALFLAFIAVSPFTCANIAPNVGFVCQHSIVYAEFTCKTAECKIRIERDYCPAWYLDSARHKQNGYNSGGRHGTLTLGQKASAVRIGARRRVTVSLYLISDVRCSPSRREEQSLCTNSIPSRSQPLYRKMPWRLTLDGGLLAVLKS